jgi:murein DD-endopeptidase MepM/ murein hydrolase activator NlpD
LKKNNFKKIVLPIVVIGILFIVIRKCSFHSLPEKKLQLFEFSIEENYDDNEYQLLIKNPVKCPMRVLLSSQDNKVNEILNNLSPILLEASADTLITIKNQGDLADKIDVALRIGNPEITIQSSVIKSLPYPKYKAYDLLQGNNSSPTHNSNTSKYAFDFNMSIGDTVTSAQDGYVIGVVDGYNGWGNGDKWKSYANQIMIYDTVTHLFTMYGHLKQNSSLVQVGHYVTIGEPIALSGQTGQAQEEHLHFNVLQADNVKGGLKSYRLDSIGNYKVNELKRYQLMTN